MSRMQYSESKTCNPKIKIQIKSDIYNTPTVHSKRQAIVNFFLEIFQKFTFVDLFFVLLGHLQ